MTQRLFLTQIVVILRYGAFFGPHCSLFLCGWRLCSCFEANFEVRVLLLVQKAINATRREIQRQPHLLRALRQLFALLCQLEIGFLAHQMLCFDSTSLTSLVLELFFLPKSAS